MTTQEWHRRKVGGAWEVIGKHQFDFLVKQGLQPENYFLDVGCGSLRGGVHYIKHLDTAHYYGIDINQTLLDAGRDIELPRYNLTDKEPILVQMDDFGFQRLGQRFDFAIAQSVFTHIPLNDIIVCLMNIEKVLAPGGKFFATFFENPQGKHNLEPISYSVDNLDFLTFFNQNPYHYDFATFEWICSGTKLKAEYIGDWGHPRNQRMLQFTLQN
jgi:SAM-dependent methyltransferase